MSRCRTRAQRALQYRQEQVQRFREHRDFVHRYLRRRVHNHELAEDLSSETFLRAWVGWGQYVDDGRTQHWLARLARSTLVDYLRCQRLQCAAAPGLHQSPCQWATEDFQRLEDQEWTAHLLRPLTDGQRKVILGFDQGYSQQEIATELGLSCGAVRVLRFRGVNRIRKS
jgi:RNA polymerase sigma-70 factor (ECF subfamily)